MIGRRHASNQGSSNMKMMMMMASVMVSLSCVEGVREFCQSNELLFCNNIPRLPSGDIDYNLPNGNASKPWYSHLMKQRQTH
jgi:hypothetical protein